MKPSSSSTNRHRDISTIPPPSRYVQCPSSTRDIAKPYQLSTPSPTLVCPTPNHQQAVPLSRRGSWPHTLLLPPLLEKQPSAATPCRASFSKNLLGMGFPSPAGAYVTMLTPPLAKSTRDLHPPPPSHDIKPSNFNVTEYQYHNRKVHRCNALHCRSRDRRCRIIVRVAEQVSPAAQHCCWP